MKEATTDSVAAAGPPAAVGLAPLLGVMLKVGVTGFGMGMMGVLQQEVVTRRQWLGQDDFSDGIALANLLPGPIAVDVAVYVGYRLRGWLGATLCLLALLLPAFCIMLAFTVGYVHYHQAPAAVQKALGGVFAGLRAALIALIISVAYRIGARGVKGAPQLIVLGAALVALFLKVNLVLLILVCGAAGALFLRPARKAAS